MDTRLFLQFLALIYAIEIRQITKANDKLKYLSVREVMEQTKASFALIAPEYEAEFAADSFATRPLLDAASSDLPAETRVASPVSSRGDELAYAVFTSGSTGKPKGVMVDQQAVCNTLH